ncbi:unnamed protein product [Clonostachys solani]|uniref:Glycosyl hydrolase family 13 catalytic domain-containing protein n=1 Tax=Clonostachys solani TaxID=160281 RepID=A0A9N9ZEB5_9HYPO|nr:unnamed protein product [Clonostachys solani]
MERESASLGGEPVSLNQTIFQGFEWYIPADHQHWIRLSQAMPSLASLGITSIWIPPATKAMRSTSEGYDAYDLYDLGEFERHGTKRTKYGDKRELVQLSEIANRHGVSILFDAILNHKMGADNTESVRAVKVDPEGMVLFMIKAWTKYDFPGRGEKYSSMKWNKDHFTGVDYDQKSKRNGVWRFQGKDWAHDVDEELTNYDFLLGQDIDHSHHEVREDLFNWVEWLSSQLRLGGLRLDAIKHFSASFLRDFVRHIDQNIDAGTDWFIVGEYWRADSKVLSAYIEYMNHRMSLFDVPLLTNFYNISKGILTDARRVFDGSLAAVKPKNAVTFVVNHDTQAGQSLEVFPILVSSLFFLRLLLPCTSSPDFLSLISYTDFRKTIIEPWFLPLAYSLILLRENFGIPCVFWADLYGTLEPTLPQPPPSNGIIIPRLILARKLWAYGTETLYFEDSPTCAGLTRAGHPSRSAGAGLAVVMNTGWTSSGKHMCVGKVHAGETWSDVLGQTWGEVIIDTDGMGYFRACPRSVSVWVHDAAEGRDEADSLVFDDGGYSAVQGAMDKIKLREPLNTMPAWLQSTTEA